MKAGTHVHYHPPGMPGTVAPPELGHLLACDEAFVAVVVVDYLDGRRATHDAVPQCDPFAPVAGSWSVIL